MQAWREANPQGLMGRLVELHLRSREKALVLSRYLEPHLPGLLEDVIHWR
ncbi:hypothetical protein [Thermus sp.]|nr:hypothetical protein [Thermus sp.]MCS6868608.1 hypothetical protein [Thermus sp.]